MCLGSSNPQRDYGLERKENAYIYIKNTKKKERNAMSSLFRKCFQIFLHDIQKDPATLFQGGLLRMYLLISPLSLETYLIEKLAKDFKRCSSITIKTKMSRDLIKILEGGMDRVITSIAMYNHKVDIEKGLHPRGKAASLPHRTPERPGTEKTLGK